jgi:CHASE2 domain-containing sensor protein
MTDELSRLLDKWPILVPLTAASAIFLGGYSSYRSREHSSALMWWIWSAVILFVSAVSFAALGMWISLAIDCLFLVADVGWIAWRMEDDSDSTAG